MSPSCCWFLVFLGLWWLPLMMLVVAEEQQGGDCSSMKCGNVNISDPFWLTDKDTGRSCSSDPYQDFDVGCTNNISNIYPSLRSTIPFNKGFKILNISYEKRSFYAVDLGKLEVLRATDKCHAPFYNTSIKLNRPFRIDPVNLNLILYNCTEKNGAAAAARRHKELVQTSVSCGNQWAVLARAGVPHDATGNYAAYTLKGCAAVVVPVPSSSARANASHYEQLFKDGFLLTWDPPHHPFFCSYGSGLLFLPGPWLSLMLAVVAADEHVEACSANKCGNTTISHPFWLPNWETGRSCGSPEFEVSCRDNGTIPVILNSAAISLGFAIVNISYGDDSLHVVDRGKLELLHASSSCGLPMWNTSVKLGPRFRIAPVNLNLILYNCTKAAGAAALAQDRDLVQTRMRCGDESEVFVRAGGSDYESIDYAGHEGCDAAVTPVLGTWSGEVNASDYQRLISDGFLLTWESPSTDSSYEGSRKMTTGTILKIVGAGLGGAVLMACLGCFVWYKRKMRKQAVASNEFMRSGSSMTSYSKDLELDGSPHIFTFEELEVATDGFSASRELGDGGFGTVYKGKLKDGRVVAVKRLYKNNYRRVEQFLNEVDILSRLLHQNLVILYGCTSRMSRDLLLVYEFIANGTVADHLHGPRAAERGLTWPLRLNIAIETAEALAYLHAVEIIHRDVKTTNILLDNSFHVKVADFGLSRLFPLEVTHVSTVPQGTPGYVDPVYHQCYKLTDKSDVYSFGVVLVELISSKPAVDMSRSHSEINLANMALNRIQNHEVVQLVDPELGYDTDPKTKGAIDRVAEVAFQCLQMERDLRPSIKEVVEILTCVRDEDCQAKSMTKKASQKEDACLLKDGIQFSPDTVIHRFHSQSTNHSVASNASGLSNNKC